MNCSTSIRWTFVAALYLSLLLSWHTETSGQDPLDEQLFQELEDDLFSDLDPLPAKSNKAKPDAKSGPVITDDLDLQLQRELGGEELGQPARQNPLKGIAESMRQVRRRIQAKDLATETQQIQGRIVTDLGKLIELLQKQNQQQQQNQSQQQQQSKQQQDKQQNQSQQQQSKPNPQQSNNGNQPSQPARQPSQESKTQQVESQSADTSTVTRDRMMQDAWGNLPASVQEEMRSARPEKFLPKYSRLIEEYFKRLAEDRKQ